VTLYNNVRDCDANEMTAYRVIKGTTKNKCYDLEYPEDMYADGLICDEFTRGGGRRNGKFNCGNEVLRPMSVIVDSDGPAVCSFSNNKGCSGAVAEAPAFDYTCQNPLDTQSMSRQFFRSFKCTVSYLYFALLTLRKLTIAC